ncbi:hypothetical protein M6C19_000118 [Staphylococcus pseudintermedius]|nr:hypothetical protein [Staphylococcus pseudintermedius]EGQ3075633.1 hypothetical protein [Staphylococcus pseudintermedius]EGQ3367146.1 hypothetical protein [Staphylococcus pseudintermedius]EGQ3381996.1 hypothetical protein [Staphylococcus pseudintermedius]EGQ3546156.1 hypothetical protein [Staphylococcus pseudintermedius]
MARTSIELITGYTKAGKPQTKKYLAKPVMTMFDTMQGAKLSAKLTKAFRAPDFEELTEEEFEKLSETEKSEYETKIMEYQEQISKQFELLEEASVFIVEGFGNQFTSDEFLRGIPGGADGFETLRVVLEKLISGDVDDTKKFVSEKKK